MIKGLALSKSQAMSLVGVSLLSRVWVNLHVYKNLEQLFKAPQVLGDPWLRDGEPVTVCGWGSVTYPGTLYPNRLHCVTTHIVG